jgi:amino acid adenylation domain-containing protein
MGVGPDLVVGICAERSLEMVVGLLGILKAGGAYLPLDPGYPAERLAYMLADSGVSVLLTQERLQSSFGEVRARLLCLDKDWPVIGREKKSRVRLTATAEDLAYVIYTSGTTGLPKGTAVAHRSIVNSTLGRQVNYRNPVGRCLVPSSFAFDVFTGGAFWAWSGGGALIIPDGDTLLDPVRLADLIRREQVTHIPCIPAMYAPLLKQARPHELDSLRVVVLGGESCPPSLVQEHFTTCPEALLYIEYGPTEATVWSTVHRVESAEPGSSVPIGRPIANTQIYIVDRDLSPVPIGVAGELLIGGAGVARGYLHRPGLTAEKFIPDPFGTQAGGRLYRTGDLARWLADGNIEYLGRIDHQVKIRGFRIELGEIEAALGQHRDVAACVVLAREDTPGDKALVAYVVPASAQEPATADIRAHLKETLPDYMVPSAFVMLEALPLTPNGKVDRKALPAPSGSREGLSSGYEAPRSEFEETLARIWAEVLHLERVGIYDNFFELGGHSLLAVTLASRIRSSFGVPFSLVAVFAEPTIAALGESIENVVLAEIESLPEEEAQRLVHTMDNSDKGLVN